MLVAFFDNIYAIPIVIAAHKRAFALWELWQLYDVMKFKIETWTKILKQK